jgi:curved DNA-binding protein
MLGASIEVPTPSGRLQVSVPAGSKNGTKLRLKGRGIPGDPPGDLYLQLEIVLPPDSAKARELFGTLARELAFDPRQAMKG